MSESRSFGDMLAGAQGQRAERRSARQAAIDDLPRVSRPFASVKDQECESGYSGSLCDVEISEGDEAAFVNGEIACGSCWEQAQQERDDFFDR